MMTGYDDCLSVPFGLGFHLNVCVTFDCYFKDISGYSSQSRTGRDKYGPPAPTEYRLIVKNLSSRCSWQDLKDFMRQAGEGTYADAHKEWTNEGVIEFRSRSDMTRALDKLYSTDINGRKICLVEDEPRRRRSSSGSCSKSGLTSPQKSSRRATNLALTHASFALKGSLSGEPEAIPRMSVSENSQSCSPPPTENGDGERSKSPFPQEDLHQSKSPAKHPASGSASRSKSWSRSASRD
uniref:Serine and arginine rich splicing factor 6b n=1 Tax=Oncorhynchus mykiss TaxID=8022 RepID=A0A8C7QSM5_ONCMY